MKRKEVKVGLLAFDDSMRSALYGLSEFFETATTLCVQLELPLCFKTQVIVCSGPNLEGLRNRKLGEGICELDTVVVSPRQRRPDAGPTAPMVKEWLLGQYHTGTVLCSACVGSFVLADTGVLDGRRATTHWMAAEDFRNAYPKIKLVDESILVDEGDIITAGGLSAWLDLALSLVTRLGGPLLAARMGKYYLVDTGTREQRFYRSFIPRLNHGDEEVLKAQHHIAAHFSEVLDHGQLAMVSGLGLRSFQRRFLKMTGETPSVYLRKYRLQQACDQLEVSQTTVDQIGWDVGYEDASAFRRVFKQEIGLTPTAYRKRFSQHYTTSN